MPRSARRWRKQMAEPKPAEIRQARAFLGKQKGGKKMSSKALAKAASELGKSFAETMEVVRAMFAARSGRSPSTQSPIADAIAGKE